MRLRVTGVSVVCATLLDVALAVDFAISAARRAKSTLDLSFSIVEIAAIAAVAILLVVVHEFLRKRGDAVFEEVSDELQWDTTGRRKTTEAGYAGSRPLLDARITLRSFASSSDLPLVPGKLGPAFYATLNILVLLVSALMMIVRSNPTY